MKWTWLTGLALLLCSTMGCSLTEEEIRPPENPEEFNIPPVEDPRWSKHTVYPSDMLNKPLPRRKGPPAGSGLPPRGQRPGIGLNGLRPGGAGPGY